MASTYPTITRLYDETIDRIGADALEWAGFLRSASWNYKLPFHEQALVYAQRPDATAVLDFDRWKRLFNRRVRRGSVGIAVFGDPGTGKLRYYFDVSDTDPMDGRSVSLGQWEAPDAEMEIAQALADAFDFEGDFPALLDTVIAHAAETLAEDNAVRYRAE